MRPRLPSPPPRHCGSEQRVSTGRPLNILDDQLAYDADQQGGLTAPLADRMRRLINQALTEKAAGVLLTCSMYGDVARGYDEDVPVLAPDQAMFDEVLAANHPRVLIVASLESARQDTKARLEDFLKAEGSSTTVASAVAPSALEAASSTDADALVTALLEVATASGENPTAVVLAQYSLFSAAPTLAARLGMPVLSGPRSAAIHLRSAIHQ